MAVGSRESLLGCSACASLGVAQGWGCSPRYQQMLAAFPGYSSREPRACRRALGGEIQPPQCPLSPAPSRQADIEQLDPRGRTPLHLATTLGHLECARVLLKHGADVGKENRSGWTGERGVSLPRSSITFPWHGHGHGHGHVQPGTASPQGTAHRVVYARGFCAVADSAVLRRAMPCHAVPPPPATAPLCPAVLQEAVSTRDLELVQLVLRYRDYQRAIKRLAGIPILLEKLRKVPPSDGATGAEGGCRPQAPPDPAVLSTGPGLLRGDEVGIHQLG